MTQSGHSLAFSQQPLSAVSGGRTRQRHLSASKLLCLGVSLLVLGGVWGFVALEADALAPALLS